MSSRLAGDYCEGIAAARHDGAVKLTDDAAQSMQTTDPERIDAWARGYLDMMRELLVSAARQRDSRRDR